MGTGRPYTGLKWSECEAKQLFPSCANVKNVFIYSSFLQQALKTGTRINFGTLLLLLLSSLLSQLFLLLLSQLLLSHLLLL